jgi:hypothetical protein
MMNEQPANVRNCEVKGRKTLWLIFAVTQHLVGCCLKGTRLVPENKWFSEDSSRGIVVG